MAPELLPVPPVRGGAIERWIRDAAVRLAARGHDVHVVSRDHGDGAREQVIDGVRYHFVRIPPALESGLPAAVARGLWYYLGARRRLAVIAPDIVHHHSRPAGLWLGLGGAPFAAHVISLHSMEYGWSFGYRRWDRALIARGLRAASRVLCVSDFIRQHTLERYPALRETTTTVYNGVDGETFHPSPETERAATPPRILYVGRVEERKGVHVLLDAFERVISPALPEATLRIVGPHSYWDGAPSAYYRDVEARAAAHSRIELRGPTYVDDELAALYRDADVSVVPSVFPEALGLTALEAQASGVPVVVSNAGGLPETVSPGESGLVFENGSADGLGRAVLELLADAPRRRAMAAAARTWAMARFSWDVIAGQLEAVYHEARPEAAR
ncbi:MAG: glycosyltransferase family 4 protein [Vicinamibacterales bacterium]|nr:glycosyltransferase family 4 protein [Vicinamibacterales bacterium]